MLTSENIIFRRDMRRHRVFSVARGKCLRKGGRLEVGWCTQRWEPGMGGVASLVRCVMPGCDVGESPGGREDANKAVTFPIQTKVCTCQ